jgi:AcrR family transcriptional regulator
MGTLYQRFSDKDAILRTILDGYRSFRLREINALCDVARVHAHNAAEIVALHVDIIFSAFRNDAGLLRLMEMRRLVDPAAHAQLVAANAEVADKIAALLQLRLPERDPISLARRVHYLHNIIRGSVVWATLPQVGDPTASLDLCDPGYADAAVAMALCYLDIQAVTPRSSAGR